MTIDESADQEHLIRNSQTELAGLKQELETIKRIKDSAIQENRRLQDDLASVTCDCRDSRKELELYKRQVDDLKTQLQQYVAEVKRTEDLISNKEIERSELLDQFRSLSHEANILENNNHTLENEASQSRVQLSVALDHASDLERKLENKESIILSYEKQIGELTSQIASLEIQLRQFMTQYERADAELQNMRDQCLRLEGEKSKIKRNLRDTDDHRQQLDRNVEQLRSERELLHHNVTRDRRTVESVEKDLHDAKHDTTELRLLNQDLQEEVQRLKVQVQDLKEKLYTCVCDQASQASPPPSTNGGRSEAANNTTNDLKSDSSLIRLLRDAMPSKCSPRDCSKYKNTRVANSGYTKTDVPCFCLDVDKKQCAKRPQINCRPGFCPALLKDVRQQDNIKSCFTLSGPKVKSYVANYTVVHDTHRVDSPKCYIKK